MKKLGEEPTVQCLLLWFPWAESRIDPAGQRPMTPLLLPEPPVRANSFTHHAILSRRIIPYNEHHGAAADTEKALSGMDWGGGAHKKGRLEGKGTLTGVSWRWALFRAG